jgi:hypothetical protein
MERGGYDSIEADEPLRQANLGPVGRLYHRLVGVPGWSGRGSRVRLLTILLMCAAVLSMFSGIYAYGATPLAIVVLAASVMCAWSIGGWLVEPYGDGWLRGLLWGLCVAAAFFLLHRIVLTVMLSVWAWIHLGTSVGQARMASAATLPLAIPAWVGFPIFGLIWRRSSHGRTVMRSGRKVIVPILILAAIVFLGAESAYMANLKR